MQTIMLEACGSLTIGYLIRSVQEAGHRCVASDIDPGCVGRLLADDFLLVPRKDDSALWDRLMDLLKGAGVSVVVPSLDETLLGWAERREWFATAGIHVALSDAESIATCQDKWETYRFFQRAGIPTPTTSLTQEHPLVKPRLGRGGQGVVLAPGPVDMRGMVSQEFLIGTEYSIDVFCDCDGAPRYVVPRKRLGVREGKSTGGIVVKHLVIEDWVREICRQLPFRGPINLQCFELADGSIRFTEINPRVAGGMALAFAATENWLNLLVEDQLEGRRMPPRPVRYGMEMRRYYAEVFVPPAELG